MEMIIKGERADYHVKCRSNLNGTSYPVISAIKESSNPFHTLKGRSSKARARVIYTAKENKKATFKVLNMSTPLLQAWFVEAVKEYETTLHVPDRATAKISPPKRLFI